jgi:2-polyprenyl-6-methoxyphenol hydroxylase-like FAD-dependent oxidoreductase
MEDAVVLGRLVGKAEEEGAGVEAVFRRYNELRRERVTENYTRASARWEGAKNRSWLFQKTMELFMWAFLMVWWNKREWGFEYDAANVELGGKL